LPRFQADRFEGASLLKQHVPLAIRFVQGWLQVYFVFQTLDVMQIEYKIPYSSVLAKSRMPGIQSLDPLPEG
jgi:hypothetical protein